MISIRISKFIAIIYVFFNTGTVGFPQETLFLDPVIPANAIQVTRDIWYGDGDPDLSNTAYLLDLYQPFPPANSVALPQKLPALVYIHGGAFQRGDKADAPAPDYCNEFARRGYVVFSINYTLDGTVGSATRDAADAIRWVRENASLYQVDTDRIIVGGHSAGAATSLNIGALEAASLGGSGADVAGVMSAAGGDFVDLGEFDLNDPPMFIINGTEDGLSPVANARNLVNRLESLRSGESVFPYSYMEPVGAGHSFLPGNGLGLPFPQPIASPLDRTQGWNNTEIQGKTVSAHCFEFFFEKLQLVEVLTQPAGDFETQFELIEESDLFEMSIRSDYRIEYLARSSTDLVKWNPVEQTPVLNGTELELELPVQGPRMFLRWQLDGDYSEVTAEAYSWYQPTFEAYPLHVYGTMGGLETNRQDSVELLTQHGFAGVVTDEGSLEEYRQLGIPDDDLNIAAHYMRYDFDSEESDLSIRYNIDLLAGTDVDLWIIFKTRNPDNISDEAFIAFMEGVLPYAREKNVRIAIYPHINATKVVNLFDSVDQVIPLVTAIDDPYLGLCLHLYHERDKANQWDQFFQQAGDKVFAVTVTDWAQSPVTQEMDYSPIIDDGDDLLKSFMQKIVASGYEGNIAWLNWKVDELSGQSPAEYLGPSIAAWQDLCEDVALSQ